uniref:Uncharacterized protein n=1 Tax=Anguilla anguilla TaxID=7936 RepID=A0A0E9PTS7_ANGAN
MYIHKKRNVNLNCRIFYKDCESMVIDRKPVVRGLCNR